MQELADNPGIGSVLTGAKGIRRYFARWKNARNGHHIFYELNEEGIVVLRVLHSSRDW
jgi:plasmid stabilization system protein ParE